ncbi:MAG: hypothetical protein IT369_20040 [Candidatus Latescibacteria bacterium]|nr:hypothetical protein [Candidatus Latescibacterota bacterium]
MSSYGWWFALLALPVLAQEKPAPTFEEQTRQILRSHLQQAEELKVGELVDELSRETRLPREQVQVRLAAWLDSMEVWRKQRRSEWEKLVKSGGVQTSAKEAEKFLRQFAAQARQALEKQSERPLEDLVDEAAKKAQVLTYQGRDLLLRLLSEQEGGALPEKVGLLVEVQSRLKDDHAIWSLLARGERRLRDETTVAGYLSPLVTEELAHSPRARWAIGQPKAGLEPDWRLVLELEELEYPRTEAGTLRQFLTGQVVLYEMKTGLELYRQPLRVNSHVSEKVEETERGPRFAGDITRRTREIFEAYWSSK